MLTEKLFIYNRQNTIRKSAALKSGAFFITHYNISLSAYMVKRIHKKVTFSQEQLKKVPAKKCLKKNKDKNHS